MPALGLAQSMIARHGRPVLLGFAPATTGGAWAQAEVLAHVVGYRATALVEGSGVQQGEREVRIAQASLDAVAAPRTPRQGDRITIDGRTVTVTSAETRALFGQPVLVILHVRGA
jgi:hypothetical protein